MGVDPTTREALATGGRAPLLASRGPPALLQLFLLSLFTINTYGFADNFFLDAATPRPPHGGHAIPLPGG